MSVEQKLGSSYIHVYVSFSSSLYCGKHAKI
jgi:hypothetical protein